jgi:hypothetical protein
MSLCCSASPLPAVENQPPRKKNVQDCATLPCARRSTVCRRRRADPRRTKLHLTERTISPPRFKRGTLAWSKCEFRTRRTVTAAIPSNYSLAGAPAPQVPDREPSALILNAVVACVLSVTPNTSAASAAIAGINPEVFSRIVATFRERNVRGVVAHGVARRALQHQHRLRRGSVDFYSLSLNRQKNAQKSAPELRPHLLNVDTRGIFRTSLDLANIAFPC